jgi:hypothetical protein
MTNVHNFTKKPDHPGAEYERDTAISKLASQIGLEKPSSPVRAEIDGVLRSAVVRRCRLRTRMKHSPCA